MAGRSAAPLFLILLLLLVSVDSSPLKRVAPTHPGYHDYDALIDVLEVLTQKHPDHTNLYSIGRSVEGLLSQSLSFYLFSRRVIERLQGANSG